MADLTSSIPHPSLLYPKINFIKSEHINISMNSVMCIPKRKGLF